MDESTIQKDADGKDSSTNIVCPCQINFFGDPSQEEFLTCVVCPSGKHTPYQKDAPTLRSLDRTSCTPCPMDKPVSAGSGKLLSGSLSTKDLECKACGPGEAPTAARDACERCPLNTFSHDDNAGRRCKPCRANEVTTHTASTSSAACICQQGFFLNTNVPVTDVARRVCTTCPEGAYCESGTQSVELIRALPSYWRPSGKSLRFHKCALSFFDGGSSVQRLVGLNLGGGKLNMWANCLGGRNSTCAPVFKLAVGQKYFQVCCVVV